MSNQKRPNIDSKIGTPVISVKSGGFYTYRSNSVNKNAKSQSQMDSISALSSCQVVQEPRMRLCIANNSEI